MRAINDTVVIKEIKEAHKVSGLDLYAENNQIRYNVGEVITASPNTVLEIGDKVYYDAIAGSVLRFEGKKFLILKERDIAIISE